MKESEVIVELTLLKKLILNTEENADEVDKIIEMINEMSDKQCKQFLITGYREISIEKFSKGEVVKRAIHKFNPIYVISEEGCHDNTYEKESVNIAERIKPSMSEREIAAIIAKVFNKIHYLNLTAEDFQWPAEEIHYYLN